MFDTVYEIVDPTDDPLYTVVPSSLIVRTVLSLFGTKYRVLLLPFRTRISCEFVNMTGGDSEP